MYFCVSMVASCYKKLMYVFLPSSPSLLPHQDLYEAELHRSEKLSSKLAKAKEEVMESRTQLRHVTYLLSACCFQQRSRSIIKSCGNMSALQRGRCSLCCPLPAMPWRLPLQGGGTGGKISRMPRFFLRRTRSLCNGGMLP